MLFSDHAFWVNRSPFEIFSSHEYFLWCLGSVGVWRVATYKLYVEQNVLLLPLTSGCPGFLDVSLILRNPTEQLQIMSSIWGFPACVASTFCLPKLCFEYCVHGPPCSMLKPFFFHSLSSDTLKQKKWRSSWLNSSPEGWQLQHPLMITLVHDWRLLSGSLLGNHHELQPRKNSQPLILNDRVRYPSYIWLGFQIA